MKNDADFIKEMSLAELIINVYNFFSFSIFQRICATRLELIVFFLFSTGNQIMKLFTYCCTYIFLFAMIAPLINRPAARIN